MTVAEAFEAYSSNLEISKPEQDTASRRQKEIRGVLDGALDLETDFLTGSYARDTKTKPLKDVDIFCVLKTTEDNVRQFRHREADTVLRSLKEILEKEYPGKVSPPGRRSVSINFGPEDHVISFDVVLAFKRGGGGYEIPDTSACGPWIATNPESHAELATKKNKSCDDKWKPLVKMVKGWLRHGDKPIRPSFLMEVMALHIVESRGVTSYPWELQVFFATAADEIVKDWPDPASLGPDVNDTMNLQERRCAGELLKNASEAASAARRLESKNEAAALRAWRELLGPHFPIH